MTKAPGLSRSLGVLGDPIAHSKSPAMHNAALAVLGLSHHYGAYHVAPDQLQAAIAGAGALGFLGLNLTIPHKVQAQNYVDVLDPLAQRIGAINTLHLHQGCITGYNTDAPGFVRGWQELGQAVPSQVLLLGSGGAAKAILEGMAQAWPNAQFHWMTRNPGQLVVLPHLRDRTRVHGYQELNQGDWPESCTLWVNATSVGLKGGPDQFPVPLPMQHLSAEHGVVDIVYSTEPAALRWHCQAQARGAKLQDGRVMLLWQGVLALQIWLEREISRAAIDAMRSALGLVPADKISP